MQLDEVTVAGFQTRPCHFQTFQVAAISCADRCITGEGGARAARQAEVIHKWSVLTIISFPPDPGYSGRHRCELALPGRALSLSKKGKKIKNLSVRKPQFEKTSDSAIPRRICRRPSDGTTETRWRHSPHPVRGDLETLFRYLSC
jgi:hypothetical protein